jgi:acyl carrier protein
MDKIKEDVRDFILREFFPDEDAKQLGDDVALASTRLLDSLSMLRLVAFLEENYGFEAAPSEVTFENLDTITAIASYVRSKSS